MIHLDVIKELAEDKMKEFNIRATGQYYTHKIIADNMYDSLLKEKSFNKVEKLKVIDPFAGDGRLILWLIEKWIEIGLPNIVWDIYLFDLNPAGLETAEFKLEELKLKGIQLNYTIEKGDAFKLSKKYKNHFDLIVTNPPWELLKPDRKELEILTPQEKARYIQSMRDYDNYLAKEFSLSQPKKKFAGWGTNLSRVGTEVSYNLCNENGFCAIVLPASFFADEQSLIIRKEIILNGTINEIFYYPAETMLFQKADVTSSALIYQKLKKNNSQTKITIFDKNLKIKSSEKINLIKSINEDFSIPISLGANSVKILKKLQGSLDSWMNIEKTYQEFWAGREIDETGSKFWLDEKYNLGPKFIKGRMINRYSVVEEPKFYVKKENWTPPTTCTKVRIAWRDVSRQSQKRRIIATIIPKDTIAGNSLGVIFYKDSDTDSLYALLGLMNSLCFEFQLRCHLSTNHISLSALRKVYIPKQDFLKNMKHLIDEVRNKLEDSNYNEFVIEAIVARDIYKLTNEELILIMNTFDTLSDIDKKSILEEFEKEDDLFKIKISNHFSSKLSDLDMKIVHSVPPGGNWKNIPEDIQSKRIENIRKSYELGEGSRSTYYGRLLPTKPSYTINTYFSRPGNGCHIHYEQNRVLSQREAARLQSFPDDFVFFGSKTAINTQIGNAVPPLLSYQIAKEIEKSIEEKGVFIDLFSGAGGMALGFKWAGWTPLLANDIEKTFLETYAFNIHDNIICGSISDEAIFNQIVKQCKILKKEHKDKPFWILGGPPCQGFSTAGNKRSMEDERNTLFLYYKKLLEEVRPDGFVFENVAGLLSMDKGRVFKEVNDEFSTVMGKLNGWVLNSEDYAIPQRRKRVILIGANKNNFNISIPKKITERNENEDLLNKLKPWISVENALSDLPPISQNQDGSNLNYICSPKNGYQKLMRGKCSPEKYLSEF